MCAVTYPFIAYRPNGYFLFLSHTIHTHTFFARFLPRACVTVCGRFELICLLRARRYIKNAVHRHMVLCAICQIVANMLPTACSATHVYEHVPPVAQGQEFPADEREDKTSGCCGKSCGSKFVRIETLYFVCIFFDLLAIVSKQVILYWCSVFTSLVILVCCGRCACLAITIQLGLGVFLYVYWLNVFKIWHRPQYHYGHSWPWFPHI